MYTKNIHEKLKQNLSQKPKHFKIHHHQCHTWEIISTHSLQPLNVPSSIFDLLIVTSFLLIVLIVMIGRFSTISSWNALLALGNMFYHEKFGDCCLELFHFRYTAIAFSSYLGLYIPTCPLRPWHDFMCECSFCGLNVFPHCLRDKFATN